MNNFGFKKPLDASSTAIIKFKFNFELYFLLKKICKHKNIVSILFHLFSTVDYVIKEKKDRRNQKSI